MPKPKKFGLLYLVAFGIMLFLNYWSATEVGSTAEEKQALIQPAGYAFSIWGLIYLSLFIWIIRLFFIKTFDGTIYDKVKVWLILNFALNGAWIVVFTNDMTALSTAVIIALLITLVIIYRMISKIRYNFFDRFPFSIYFAWVTVATIVDIFTWAVSSGTEQILGLNEYTWTIIMLMVGTVLCIYISIKYHDWIYPLVFVWSYVGILIKNMDTSLMIFISIGITLQAVCALFAAYQSWKKDASRNAYH